MIELATSFAGGGGLFPALPASAVNTVALTAATASSQQDVSSDPTTLGTGTRALWVWFDDYSADIAICFYPVSGSVGIACPSTALWPPLRLAGAWTDGRGMGPNLFRLDNARKFFRVIHGATCSMFWAAQPVSG